MDATAAAVTVLNQYADAAGVDRQSVISDYKFRYTDAGLVALGNVAQGVNFGALAQKIQTGVDAGDFVSPPYSASSPSRAALYGVLIAVGGSKPSSFSLVAGGLSDTATALENGASTLASGALSGLKYVAIIAVVAGIGYLLFQTGALKRVAGR